MSDIPWAPEVIDKQVLVRAVLRRVVGIGMLVGAGEMVSVAATVKITLGFDDALLLGVCSVLLSIVLALCLGVPIAAVGAWLHRGSAVRAARSRRSRPTEPSCAAALALC